MIKKILSIPLFLFCGICCFAAHFNYYISATGDNTTGRSPANAWTMAKLMTQMGVIIAGDSVLFKSGELFYGNIILINSGTIVNPIYFGSYGAGAKPIITGLSTVTGWVNLGGNIWEAPTSGVRTDVNLVLRNRVIQQVGRYPNSSYLTYTSSTATTITGPALSTTTNWTGAEVAIRLFRWEIRRRTVTIHSGGILDFNTMVDIPKVNYGYFFQRDLRTLDTDGEWYQNGSTNKLRMYFSNNNPSVYNIQVATKDTLVKSTKSNLVFENLSFYGCNKAAIMQIGGSNIIIKNCTANKTGEDAFTAWFSTEVTVDNCYVDSSLGSGIRIRSASSGTVNITVKNCLVRNTALIAGMEPSTPNNSNINIADGIQVYGGDNVTVTNNVIKNSGYNAIGWNGNNLLIKNNYIDSFCLVRDDGAGIYSFTVSGGTIVNGINRRIVSNIIDNGLGYAPGTDVTFPSANGIYTDEGTRDVYMDSNTIARVAYNGFQGNNNSNLVIRANTVFNSYVAFAYQRLNNGPIMRGFKAAKNIFYPYRFRYRNLALNLPSVTTKEIDIPAMFDILDSNYYSLRSGIDTSLWATVQWNDKTHTSSTSNIFSYLTGTIGVENHSINKANTGTLYYNASGSPSLALFSGLSKIDVFGTVYNNSANIPAWQSKILLPNGSTSTSNASPVAIAGSDQIITLPTNTTNIMACGSFDSDGSIALFTWRKILGPSGGYITDSSECITSVTSLLQGIYKYELTITDNLGATGKDTVQITVNAAATPMNIPPNVTAGGDQVITLPRDSVTIVSSATDIDGVIDSYHWVQISGPGFALIVNEDSATAEIHNLIQGTYKFEVTATDDSSATDKDTVQVIVNAAALNQSPFANAGPDRDITLPIDYTTLDGSLSSDSDGSIVSYVWKEGATTVGTGVSINLIGLTQGLHTYILTVTDDDGATGTDIVTVLVRQPTQLGLGTLLLGYIMP